MNPQKTYKKILSSITVAGLALSIMSAQALTISPARAELTGDKGETISDSFLIINEQETQQTFYTTVENFDSQGETGTPNFTTSKEGLPSWVTVPEKITLNKGERVKIPYSIAIPQNAESGGHFAAIFLSTVPPAIGEGQVSVGAKVGMLILLKVTGDVKEEGGLLSFTIQEGKKFLTSLPVHFSFRFNNKGNDRVKPEGDIVVKNMFGVETARIDANKSLGNILPGSVRHFEAVLGDAEAPAPSAAFFDHVKFQMNHFAFGAYFATVSLKFGNAGVAESSLTYFVLPWQLMVVVTGLVLIVLVLLATLLKRYNKWIIKQARQAAKK